MLQSTKHCDCMNLTDSIIMNVVEIRFGKDTIGSTLLLHDANKQVHSDQKIIDL